MNVAEFCPGAPSGTHTFLYDFELDGLAVDRCMCCSASRILLGAGLREFLLAVHTAAAQAALEAYDLGYDAAGDLHSAAERRDMGFWSDRFRFPPGSPAGPESGSGTNKEHAKSADFPATPDWWAQYVAQLEAIFHRPAPSPSTRQTGVFEPWAEWAKCSNCGVISFPGVLGEHHDCASYAKDFP